MVRKSKGRMTKKTRYLGRSATKRRVTVADLVKVIAIGSRVQLVPNSKYEDFPAPRYAGRVGTVMEKRGKAYVVKVKNGKHFATLITSAVHLKNAQ